MLLFMPPILVEIILYIIFLADLVFILQFALESVIYEKIIY